MIDPPECLAAKRVRLVLHRRERGRADEIGQREDAIGSQPPPPFADELLRTGRLGVGDGVSFEIDDAGNVSGRHSSNQPCDARCRRTFATAGIRPVAGASAAVSPKS